MTPRVAITRTQPEAGLTAHRVRAFRGEPIVASLLKIEARPFDSDVAAAQAVLFTSANGVRALALQNVDRKMNVVAVGDATAAQARSAGYAGVLVAEGDVRALAKLVLGRFDPGAGPLVHIAGAHVAGDLDGQLRSAGFTYERRIAYEAVAVTTLPAALLQPLDIILFHSARAAETFVNLGAPNAAKLIAGCLSEAVAQAARVTVWKQIIVAPAPREDALLAATLGGQNSPAGASA
ncbi:MAG: uroporphyrinogen-III synthase [Hyphomonadaceae bacterium]|nr:uroporphyrinogen-III synthase [Hyphomonadaceae bacterium]